MIRIKELRMQKNITQQELADALDLDRTAIAKYETNKNGASSDTLLAIANYFDVSVDYLLGNDTSTPNTIPKQSPLQELVLRSGKPQKQIAAELGLSASAFNQYITEKRKPSQDILIKISKYFNVSLEYLFGIDEVSNYSNSTINERIRACRLEKGLSQRQLALSAGLSNATISRIEQDIHKTPDTDTILKIAKALHLDPSVLFLSHQNATRTDSTLADTIGQRIKILREQRNLSQNALAKKAGISQSGLNSIERTMQSPSLNMLIQISNALDVSLSYLLDINNASHESNISTNSSMKRLENAFSALSPDDQEFFVQMMLLRAKMQPK